MWFFKRVLWLQTPTSEDHPSNPPNYRIINLTTVLTFFGLSLFGLSKNETERAMLFHFLLKWLIFFCSLSLIKTFSSDQNISRIFFFQGCFNGKFKFVCGSLYPCWHLVVSLSSEEVGGGCLEQLALWPRFGSFLLEWTQWRLTLLVLLFLSQRAESF